MTCGIYMITNKKLDKNMLVNPLILKIDGADIVEKEQKILLMLIEQQKNMAKTISELMLLQSYLQIKNY